jgi:hypothetical protein
MSRARTSRPPRIGDSVLVLTVPDSVRGMALVSRRAFRLAVGHQFKVRGRDECGCLELRIGRVADRVLGGFMHTIWIEPECVRVVRRRPRAAFYDVPAVKPPDGS